MSAFVIGFEKIAKGKPKDLWKVLSGAKDKGILVAGGLKKGLKSSGNVALKDHLKLEGLGDNLKQVWNSKYWQQKGQALGRAVPGLAAGGAYLYGAKKLYDATLGGSSDKGDQYTNSMNNYYGY